MAYRVLIVEDQEMPRQLFEIFVNSSVNYIHAGSVANAGLALSMCRNQQIDLILMLFIAAVGKIQPRNVHAGKAHLSQCLFIFTGRTDGANDFCFSHNVPPIV